MTTTIDGSASVTINSGAILGITSGTAVASTSGTSIDFTSIPSWVKRITVMFNGVSTNGTSNPQIQLGDSGGIEASGYLSGAINLNVSSGPANSTTGLLLDGNHTAADIFHGNAVITLMDASTNLWSFSCFGGLSNAAAAKVGGGSKSLSATLDRIRLTTVNGTDTFDAGSINILYEG